jgi:hypothetical protein
MAMNFAPLDCSCQGASSEPKKIYLDFSVLEKFAKNQKIHIFGSHSKKWVQWPELLLYLNSTDPILWPELSLYLNSADSALIKQQIRKTIKRT